MGDGKSYNDTSSYYFQSLQDPGIEQITYRLAQALLNVFYVIPSIFTAKAIFKWKQRTIINAYLFKKFSTQPLQATQIAACHKPLLLSLTILHVISEVNKEICRIF